MTHFIHRDGQSLPVDVSQLRAMAADGRLRRDEPVYVNTQQAWLPAETLAELSDAWPRVAPPPPPPQAPSPPRPAAEPSRQAALHSETATGAPHSPFPTSADLESLLRRAFGIYRNHFVPLLITAAILLVPATLMKSCAVAVITLPTRAVAEMAHAGLQSDAERTSERAAALSEAMRDGKGDPEALRKAAEEYKESLQEVSRDLAVTGTAVAGGFLAMVLGLVASFVASLLILGIALPLVRGALTVAVADILTGGTGDPGRAWRLLLQRIAPLLGAVLPAALIIALGTLMFVLPGLVASFLFVFVAPIVLVEKRTGLDALKRSIELVTADWVRVLVVAIVFAVVTWLAHFVAHLIALPFSFFGSMLEDLLALVVLPFPIIGTVLLYFDLRQRLDGVDPAALRASLQT